VFRRLNISGDNRGVQRIVVAGPGSALTIPGIIVSEIVRSLAKGAHVTRVEVDLSSNQMTGLHRAPSLSAWHNEQTSDGVIRRRAPVNARLRSQTFHDLLGPDVNAALAYAWPGIDNSWIRQFIRTANSRRIPTTVLCASLPKSSTAQVSSLSEIMSFADRIFVGEPSDATALATTYGSRGPVVEIHGALSLKGRGGRLGGHEITAFLPKDNRESLATLLAAFDAIPETWISDYQLRIAMRYSDDSISEMVKASHHADRVALIGENMGVAELEELCAMSSALSVADPASDSRAFSSAIDSGVATVLLTTSAQPQVGRGYVGGLLADLHRPASVSVALSHALRLEELRFPNPVAWDQLARRLLPVLSPVAPIEVFEPANDG